MIIHPPSDRPAVSEDTIVATIADAIRVRMSKDETYAYIELKVSGNLWVKWADIPVDVAKIVQPLYDFNTIPVQTAVPTTAHFTIRTHEVIAQNERLHAFMSGVPMYGATTYSGISGMGR